MGTFVCFWDEIKEGKGTIFIGKNFIAPEEPVLYVHFFHSIRIIFHKFTPYGQQSHTQFR